MNVKEEIVQDNENDNVDENVVEYEFKHEYVDDDEFKHEHVGPRRSCRENQGRLPSYLNDYHVFSAIEPNNLKEVENSSEKMSGSKL